MKERNIINFLKIIVLIQCFLLLLAPISLSINIRNLDEKKLYGEKIINRSIWPPTHKDVEFLPRVNVVNITSNSDTHYNFFIGIPMTVFHHNNKVYQSLLTTDHFDNNPTSYIIDDWESYLEEWGGTQHINFIGNTSLNQKNIFIQTYNISWDNVSNITGNPISIANQIADHDWRETETIIIAPYISSPTDIDYESIANAAVIASLLNAPLLLTDPSTMTVDTITLIEKLGASEAILVEIGDTLTSNINSQLNSISVLVTNELTLKNDVVSIIRSLTNHSTLCGIIQNEQSLPASLYGARYGGFVLHLPDTFKDRNSNLKSIIDNLNQSVFKLDNPEDLPREFRSGEESLAQNFYDWLDDIDGNDTSQLETVITFNTQPYYDSVNGFDVYFDRAISGDPSSLDKAGAVSGRMPLQYIENIALTNRDSMYRATIFSNPRPKHVTLAMNAYEVEHTVNSELDKWGGNHIINEIFGYPYRGWIADNGYFPWTDIQNNTPQDNSLLLMVYMKRISTQVHMLVLVHILHNQ